jgi:hypothetical protein
MTPDNPPDPRQESQAERDDRNLAGLWFAFPLARR